MSLGPAQGPAVNLSTDYDNSSGAPSSPRNAKRTTFNDNIRQILQAKCKDKCSRSEIYVHARDGEAAFRGLLRPLDEMAYAVHGLMHSFIRKELLYITLLWDRNGKNENRQHRSTMAAGLHPGLHQPRAGIY